MPKTKYEIFAKPIYGISVFKIMFFSKFLWSTMLGLEINLRELVLYLVQHNILFYEKQKQKIF